MNKYVCTILNKIFIAELKTCNVYVSRSYDYRNFIEIGDIPKLYGRYYVNFKIFVLAKKDIHILLASTDMEKDSSYEISNFFK